MTIYRISEGRFDPKFHCQECGIQLVPVERELYVTTCKNHSGGPASPHVLECFKELAGVGGETP